MHRRNFIKQSSLAAAGGILASALPLRAYAENMHTVSHVVLCIPAGVGRADFGKLFSAEMTGASLLIENMCYNGHVAGHRAALESILGGRYVTEAESGQNALAHNPLFDLAAEGKACFVGPNRHFLKWGKGSGRHPHFCIAAKTAPAEDGLRGARPHAPVESVNPAHGAEAQKLQEQLALRMADKYKTAPNVSEDALVAEAACLLLKDEAPQVTVVYFMGADVAHGQATLAKQNMGFIGGGIQKIWETINDSPKLKGKTALITLPDFGRNAQPNTIVDENGERGYDHSINDENTKLISCLITADIPTAKGKNVAGESIDLLPTIYHMLKPHAQTPSNLKGKNLLA